MPDRIGAHPLNFSEGRAGGRPEAIVIQVRDGTLAGTDCWFNDPRSRWPQAQLATSAPLAAEIARRWAMARAG
jgi:hypothetical protein